MTNTHCVNPFRIGDAVRTGAGWDAHVIELDGIWVRVEYDERSGGVSDIWVLATSVRRDSRLS